MRTKRKIISEAKDGKKYFDVDAEEIAVSNLANEIKIESVKLDELKVRLDRKLARLNEFKDADSVKKQKIVFETSIRENLKGMRFPDGRQAYSDEDIEVKVSELMGKAKFNPEQRG